MLARRKWKDSLLGLKFARFGDWLSAGQRGGVGGIGQPVAGFRIGSGNSIDRAALSRHLVVLPRSLLYGHDAVFEDFRRMMVLASLTDWWGADS